MRWNGELWPGWGAVSLIIAVILALIGFTWQETYGPQSFGVQLWLMAAGISGGVWVTLMIIEKAIKEDHEKQWESVRLITYHRILYNLIRISYMSADYLKTRDGVIPSDDVMYILFQGIYEPFDKKIPIASSDLADSAIKFDWGIYEINKGQTDFLELMKAEKKRCMELLRYYNQTSALYQKF